MNYLKCFSFCLLLIVPLTASGTSQVEESSLTTSITHSEKTPLVRFSWKLKLDGRAQLQGGYQILLASKNEDLESPEKLIWNSGEVKSPQSLFIEYDGPPLKTETDYFWKVQLTSSQNITGPWSKVAHFSVTKSQDISNIASPRDQKSISNFYCSDENLNQIFKKTVSSRKANLTTPPSFKPSEQSWGAPLQLTARGYAFEARLESYYNSWIDNFLAKIPEQGLLPATESKNHSEPIAGHSESGLFIPYIIWQLTGDTSLIDKTFDPAIAHLAAIQKIDPQFEGAVYGENGGDLGHKNDPTSQKYLSICHFALSCRVVTEIATLKGHLPYIYQHEKWFNFLRNGFEKSFINNDKRLTEKSQTAQILALRFGLLPQESKQPTADALAQRLKQEGLKAGIFGQAALLPVLSWTNHHEQAIEIAKSYGAKNAEPSEVALASTSEWMMSFLAGFIHQAPGFKVSRVSPFIPNDGSITEVKAHHETPYGKLAIHWKTSKTGLTAKVTIPPNTTGIISLPAEETATITEGGKTLQEAVGCQFMRDSNGRKEIIAQSGTYQFEVINQPSE